MFLVVQQITHCLDQNGVSIDNTTQNLSGLSAGIYNVTITDANGCTTTASTEITEPDELLIEDAGLSTEIDCHGDNGQIKVNITQQSVANYKYDLYQDDSSDNNHREYNSYFFSSCWNLQVRVTDANGCFKETDEITLTQPENLW